MSRKDDLRVEDAVIRSLVIVGEQKGTDFCSGFVATVDKASTFIFTQSKFVEGREDNVKVCFWNKVELQASVFLIKAPYCVLRTDRAQCQSIPLMAAEDKITLSRSLMFPPVTPTEYCRIPTFVTVQSLESYLRQPDEALRASDNHLLVACPYKQKTRNKSNRLFAAPVFTMDELSLGIVLEDCHASGHGAEMKLVLSAKHVRDLISTFIPSPLKRGREVDVSKEEPATNQRRPVDQGGSKYQGASKNKRLSHVRGADVSKDNESDADRRRVVNQGGYSRKETVKNKRSSLVQEDDVSKRKSAKQGGYREQDASSSRGRPLSSHRWR